MEKIIYWIWLSLVLGVGCKNSSEIIDFCKQMKYKKIGLAFCVGLAVGGSTNIAIKLGEGNKEEAEKAGITP